MARAETSADPARASAVRRATRLLVAAQVLLWCVLGLLVANAPLAIDHLTGSTVWAGVLIATLAVAQAAGAMGGGRLMDRRGRRPGLAGGYALLAAGSGVMAATIAAGRPMGLLVGTALIGAGAGAALLGRGAVAEMHPIGTRGRAVGKLLVAGVVGAVGAPPLVALLQRALDPGMDPHLVPWLIAPGLAIVALGLMLTLRPDPRDLAVDAGAAREEPRPLRRILAQPPVRAALVTVASAQTIMVAIMGVATVVVKHRGGTGLVSSILVSVHLAGMFAFTPAVGAFLDRVGRRPALALGAGISAAGALLGAFVSGVSPFGLGFFLIGLGWSGAYVASTTVVSDLTTASERSGALGFTDLLTHSCSAMGGLLGGFLTDTAGFSVLGMVLALLVVPVLVVVLPLREVAPGRWGQAPEVPDRVGVS